MTTPAQPAQRTATAEPRSVSRGAVGGPSRREEVAGVVFGVATALTAGGVLIFSLAPLALPALILLTLLAAPLLPIVLFGAVLSVIYLVMRSLFRLLWARRRVHGRRSHVDRAETTGLMPRDAR